MAERSFRDWRIYRFVTGRRRLLLSCAAGLVLYALLPAAMRLPTRLILAWDFTAVLYISATLWMFVHSTVDLCRSRAALYDEGDWIILLLVIASAGASFVAIFAELPVLKQPEQSVALALVITGVTVALSWTFTHTVFTLHYANVYYRQDDDGPGGLEFPGDREPDYRDFLYYSFVIGCAAQTGDVATTSIGMRYLSLVHGIVAFTFNTAILALTINVGASLLF
ncbi:MAG: DUF1345 domain-containing protein [Reyranella sp.]